MFNPIKRVILGLYAFSAVILTSCIGDDISGCGYDDSDIGIKKNNLFLSFNYTPHSSASASMNKDEVDNFFLMAYDENNNLTRSYVNEGFILLENKVRFEGRIDPGAYNFVFLTSNTTGQFSPESEEDYEDFHITLNHDENNNRDYEPMAYYHSALENIMIEDESEELHESPLAKITNEMTISITGLVDEGINPDIVDVDIFLPDMKIGMDGELGYQKNMLNYECKCSTDGDVRNAHVFTQPINYDMDSQIVVFYDDPVKKSREELVKTDLIQLIVEYLNASGQNVEDIKKVNHFKIDIDIEDRYISFKINGWGVSNSDQEIS